MKNALICFYNAVMAGVFIGIAGTVYLATPSPLLGPFLFAFGLLTIICYRFKLFTGAVGYWANQRNRDIVRYSGELVIIWLGNFAGCFAVGSLIRQSRSFAGFANRVDLVCQAKLADSPWSILILAFFCGILMYVAVETFRKTGLPEMARVLMVFLCVSVFILSGFEHSIAGMYYFSAAAVWNWQSLGCIGIMTVGNALGGMLLPFADLLRGESPTK